MKRARIVIDLESSSEEEPPICTVCLDDIQRGQARSHFPCAHELHASCYDRLVHHADKGRNRKVRCPSCRTEVRVSVRPRKNQVVVNLDTTAMPSRQETRRARVRRRNQERVAEMTNAKADAEERTAIRQAEDLDDTETLAAVRRFLGDGYGLDEISDYESDDGFVVDENDEESQDDDYHDADEASEPEYDGSDSSDEEVDDWMDQQRQRQRKKPRQKAVVPELLVSEQGRLMRADSGTQINVPKLLRERRRLRRRK